MSPHSAAVELELSEDATTLDDLFTRYAREVPGFGGAFFDSAGNLHVNLKDPSQHQNANDRFSALLQQYRRPDGVHAAGRVVPEQAAFDWLELRTWFTRIGAAIAGSPFTFLDIDERTNSIAIGAASESDLQVIEAAVARLSVPTSAVHYLLHIGYSVGSTLADEPPPMAGGLFVQGVLGCSLGWNVLSSGRYFVTNSHCTQRRGVVDNDVFYRAGGFRLGAEYLDPPFVDNHSNCFEGSIYFQQCRWSDAALVEYDDSVNWDFGKIARVTGSPSTGLTGPTQIDAANPRWPILFWSQPGPGPYVYVGMYLEKLGVATGWTTGQLSRSCFLVPARRNNQPTDPLVYFMCQYEVQAGANFGDSGSPVFQRVTDQGVEKVIIHGLLWGVAAQGQTPDHFIYSMVSGVDDELGWPLRAY